jgi:hypothetical protein
MPTAKTGQGKASTNGHRVIDLDQAKAARAEVAKEPVAIKFGGEEFELPAELPADFALLASEDREYEALRALFRADTERFFGLRPSLDDVTELIAQIGTVYGLSVGESPASANS